MGFFSKYATYKTIKSFSRRGRFSSLFILALLPVARKAFRQYRYRRSEKVGRAA